MSADDLPSEVLASIFQWLSCVQVFVQVGRTCSLWRSVSLDPLNRRLCMLHPIEAKNLSKEPSAAVALRRVVAAGHIACVCNLWRGNTPDDGTLITLAARHGHTNVLQWFIEKGHRSNHDACFEAAQGGHTACLKLLHRAGHRFDEEALRISVIRGHVDCVDYMLSKGCRQERRDFEICDGPPTPAHFVCVEKVIAAGFRPNDFGDESAVKNGHLDCLCLFGGESWWDEEVCAMAARRGNVQMLRYLHENGWDWDGNTCAGAAGSGHRDCLVYALTNGCPWKEKHLYQIINAGLWSAFVSAAKPDENNNRPSRTAASLGRLDLLRDVCAKGWKCDQGTCAKAAQAGSLACLAYLHDRGCLWDQQTCHAALLTKNRRCFEYAASRGCPMDTFDKRAAIELGWMTEPQALPLNAQQLARASTSSQRRRRRQRARRAKEGPPLML